MLHPAIGIKYKNRPDIEHGIGVIMVILNMNSVVFVYVPRRIWPAYAIFISHRIKTHRMFSTIQTTI